MIERALIAAVLVCPPAFGQALFGYTLAADGSIADPQPLDGATVEARPVYVTWLEVGAESVQYYCCKLYAPDGMELEPHTTIERLPHGDALMVDLTGAVLGAGRELYADITLPDGTLLQNNVALFSIGETTVVPEPPATPDVGDAQLSWEPPTEYTDGSPLTLSELSGYRIYFGTDQGGPYTVTVEIDNPFVQSWVIEDLPAGFTYYFVATAVTGEGLESAFSNEASTFIEPAPEADPSAPSDLSIWEPPTGPLVVTETPVYGASRLPDANGKFRVGDVPLGTECITTEALITGGEVFYAVPKAAVVYPGNVQPDVNFARCGLAPTPTP